MVFSHLLLRRLKCHRIAKPHHFFYKNPRKPLSSLSSSDSVQPNPTTAAAAANPTSLSARMSFVFEQIDAIDKQRTEKDQTLQRIRAWRESKKQNSPDSIRDSPKAEPEEEVKLGLVQESKDENRSEALTNVKREVELVHPWPEWIELMQRLVQQNYFDHMRKDEDGMMEKLGFDVSEAAEDKVADFTRDFKSVQNAVLNFGKDRFDILRSLSRQDIQILVGYGCPSTDKRVVFSAKLLRKHVHLDEGDVCSSCSLRSSCEKAYLLTNKEDEPRTMDVMRVLLTYGFDPVNGSVSHMPLLKMKSVKTVVRKLIHEVVKLGSVPIDPNLPPPVIKKPPPKVKQPPPPPKKRVGRDDIEMKKGDWLCPKCDFMNFAKNTVCLQCDAKRPKRQLLPGEWECPQCNFLNYRRNTVCFHCEHNRPADTYTEPQFPEKRHSNRLRAEKISSREEVSGAWNFDFDDNESDGADVASFEHADSKKPGDDFPLSRQAIGEISKGDEDGFYKSSRPPRMNEPGYSDKPRTGFNDFDEDDDDIDNYELDTRNEASKTSRIDFSELESDSESEDIENNEGNLNARGETSSRMRSKKPSHHKGSFSGSEDAEVDFDSDDDLPVHPNWKSTHVANSKQRTRDRDRRPLSFGSDDDLGYSSGSDETSRSRQNEGKRRGSNRVAFEKRGRSNIGAEPFSDSESNDDTGYLRDERRGKKAGLNSRGKPSTGRGGMMGFREKSLRDDMNRSSRGPRYDRDTQENGYEHGMKARDSDSQKFRSPRRGGSFNKQGGRSANFGNRSDSYLDDERHRRPRTKTQENGYDSPKFRSPGRGGSFNKQGGRSDHFGNRSDSYLDDERYRRPRINVR